MPNALLQETSPYLLQHAHNPVNWYPWGEEALQKAVKEDKPILVSIGYAACHWCHVMERESFEDNETAALMNEHFVNIKIDREERPDLDHIYMDAVQAMSGNGGWPLNVFLTPDKKPFYGGTYFPPKRVMNRASWKEVLIAVADAFQNKRNGIEEQANNITEHLLQSNNFGIHNPEESFSIEQINTACENLLKQADKQWGGFGAAPKFPQTFSIQFLLQYYLFAKKKNPQQAEDALKQALLSLDKMIEGGIYDQIGGGFARYSTDKEWLVPHFEKMLYDNALLIATLSDAYSLTQKEQYANTIDQTLSFVERELQNNTHGFYSALDADSEGEEGKYYTWNLEEIEALLGPDATIYCDYYNVTANGNWVEEHSTEKGKNILRILEPLPLFAAAKQYKTDEIKKLINRCNNILQQARERRTKPALDDKIILGWNALMNIAYSKAYAATGNKKYLQKAINNMKFLLSAFQSPDGSWLHVWKNHQAKYPAFLDDFAYLIQALLQLHRVTANTNYLDKAKMLCEEVISHFSEPNGYFYFTPQDQTDVIVRKKEVYDGATPSGNAVMAQNLLDLGLLFDQQNWIDRSHKMVKGLSTVVLKYPTSFGVWLSCLYRHLNGTKEIVLIGNYESALTDLLAQPIFHSVVMAAKKADNKFPLLKDKTTDKPLALFLCENYACRKPVHTLQDLIQILN